jgi:signal transduction histidine kinase/CheY-like chemotaxis protein
MNSHESSNSADRGNPAAQGGTLPPADRLRVAGIDIEWLLQQGVCTFEKLPVAMMWVDTTLAGLMSGVQAMVGTPRFLLALQSEGRKSVEADWQVISKFGNFHEGFKAIATIAAVAGWGEWELASFDENNKECVFRIKNNWEGRYQRSLGVCWGSGMLAGKMAGYCSRLFRTNCWADQTAFIARGDPYDEFVVKPSLRFIEKEIEDLLHTDEATRADLAVALRKLENEIVERKRAEEALQKAQKLESLGVLAGGIAHDFNNLLLGVFANIDMARVHAARSDEVLLYLNEAMKVFNRAKDLTRQLLTFAKGGAPLQKTGSLEHLLRETVRFGLSGSSISYAFDIAGDLWLCDFDENQMAQVVQNIILNAQEAMPSGGSITVKALNTFVKAGEYPDLDEGRFVAISIRDTGAGIPNEILPRIFDPFFTTKQKGSGLGLSIAYSIIIRHKGHIDVESEPGKGANFHILLPASDRSSLPRETSVPAVHIGSGRIMVMDDEEFVRNILGKMLKTMGYAVSIARNGSEALQLFSRAMECGSPFKAVIFDLTIPGAMGGKEAIAALRKIAPSIIAIATSGYSEDPIMSNPASFGFTASIRKPYRESELAALLNAAVN